MSMLVFLLFPTNNVYNYVFVSLKSPQSLLDFQLQMRQKHSSNCSGIVLRVPLALPPMSLSTPMITGNLSSLWRELRTISIRLLI